MKNQRFIYSKQCRRAKNRIRHPSGVLSFRYKNREKGGKIKIKI